MGTSLTRKDTVVEQCRAPAGSWEKHQAVPLSYGSCKISVLRAQ